MNNHEHLIFLNYIEQLLHGMEQVRLDRTNLPESSLPLADALEHLGANVQNAINTDSQTGVGNRRYFNLLTKSLWADKTPFCIAFIDIDGLKSCNDSHGHSEGDLYISSVCSTLESICLDDEFLFRLGGDEFLILSLSSDSNALKKRLESQRQLYHNSMKTLVTYNCDFSFGCLDIVPDDTHNFSELLSLADQKMYEQKVQHYIHRKHTSTDSTLPSSDDAIDIDKSGLDNRVFDAFALTSSNRYIYLCNLSTDVSRWSTQAVLDFDLPSEYMLHADAIWEQHIHPDDRAAYRQDINAVFSGSKAVHDVTYRARQKDGTYVRCSCEGYILRGNGPDKPDLFAGSFVSHGAVDYIDPVTKCHNIYAFLTKVLHLRNLRKGALFLVIGMNHFSTVNTAYNYQTGDLVLQRFVSLLEEKLKGIGDLFRLDGTKFAIIIPEEHSDQKMNLFQYIKKISSDDIFVENQHISLSISCASVLINPILVDESTVLTELFHAIAEAKQDNSMVLYEFNQDKALQIQDHLMLMDVIKRSVIHDCQGFFLQYQPIVDLHSDIQGVEALLRWSSPEYGTVPPVKYIPWLERDPYFYILGLWILRQAMHEIRPLLEGYPHLTLSINISYKQFKNMEFVQDVLQILEEEDFPAANLVLELTEHCQALDTDLLKCYMSDFHNYGIRIAADDFGTGYSSFSLMKDLPFDLIKIDQSFIGNILEHEINQVMVEAIIKCAKVLKLPVCVEGVETDDIFDYVKALAPGYYQGYLFAKPLSVQDLKNLLEC